VGEPTKLQEKVGEVRETGVESIQDTFITGADGRLRFLASPSDPSVIFTAVRSS
jgi:hypothetical protein